MSAPIYTAEENALAAELHAIGVAAHRAARQSGFLAVGDQPPAFAHLQLDQQAGWLAIARHVRASALSPERPSTLRPSAPR